MGVNKAILIGRLGKDPELKYTTSGKTVASFSLATSERWTGADGQKNESTTWHNIVAWGKSAEIMKEYLVKGREVYIEGRIDNRSYEDKEGVKKYISEIVVTNFQLIGGRPQDGRSDGGSGGGSAPMPEPSGAGSSDDDLPF